MLMYYIGSRLAGCREKNYHAVRRHFYRDLKVLDDRHKLGLQAVQAKGGPVIAGGTPAIYGGYGAAFDWDALGAAWLSILPEDVGVVSGASMYAHRP